MAEIFLAQRLQDRRFASSNVSMGADTAITPWYASTNASHTASRADNLTVSRHLASMGDAKPSKSIAKKARKKRPKASGSGSESYSSSSESDGGGGRRSKKSKGRCWKGYKPVPGKKAYSNDSCEKK